MVNFYRKNVCKFVKIKCFVFYYYNSMVLKYMKFNEDVMVLLILEY